MAQFIRMCLFGLLVCSSSCQPKDSSTSLTNEDYGVYSTYLNGLSFYKTVPSAESIIITDSTTMRPDEINSTTPWSWVTVNLGDRCRFLKDSVSCRKAQDPAWASLFENVKKSSQVKQEFLVPIKFRIRQPIQLLSQFRKEELNRKQYDSLTHYIFSLSKISYSADKTKALFFGSYICGGLCGRGDLIMMEKIDQTWVLIDTFRFWIA